MNNLNSFLFDHTFSDIKVIDCFKQRFDGNCLNRENVMATRKGIRKISVTPLLSYERYSQRNERLVTVKNEFGYKVKVKTVHTVSELANILKEELGMQVQLGALTL